MNFFTFDLQMKLRPVRTHKAAPAVSAHRVAAEDTASSRGDFEQPGNKIVACWKLLFGY
jgi:hypothetical protein